jgi:hypothetical protein
MTAINVEANEGRTRAVSLMLAAATFKDRAHARTFGGTALV